jgi:hypothetical protein
MIENIQNCMLTNEAIARLNEVMVRHRCAVRQAAVVLAAERDSRRVSPDDIDRACAVVAAQFATGELSW